MSHTHSDSELVMVTNLTNLFEQQYQLHLSNSFSISIWSSSWM